MKNKQIFLSVLFGVSTILTFCALGKNNNSSVGQTVNLLAESGIAKKSDEVKHLPNMVAIFEGETAQRFPFVWYTITGEKGKEKIVFDKLKVVYENGMPCFIPGSTTSEFNLSDCVLYYSNSELALAEGANNEELPAQTLADGANSKVLLKSLVTGSHK